MDDGPKKLGKRPEYLSYLIRLWQVAAAREGDAAGGRAWRGSLESSLTGERQGFASLDELVEFLQRQTDGMANAD